MARQSACFLDTCIPIYAAGKAHPYQEACARIMLAAADGELDAVTDAEVIQEIAYRFHAIRRRGEGLKLADAFLAVVETVLPVNRAVAARSLQLQRAYSFLSPRDAIHVASMGEGGISTIVTADRHFDRVREVERVDPIGFQW
ncbi:MAG: type II toxin-antitoxin system VapC family toxin [Armatimonadota bacterium]